jgi:hypothetical protein
VTDITPCTIERTVRPAGRHLIVDMNMIGIAFASLFGAAAVVPFIVSTVRTSLKAKR